ncbi:cysteine proteinase [Pelagophyceae sp. CCMP2097]|nr:cysteine proteinase [Pelagophyceae sp. CCMP2097]
MLKLTLALALGAASALKHDAAFYEPAFEQWKAKHGVSFHTRDEAAARFGIWCLKDDEIRAHNEAKSPYKLGHNQFSHLTHDEFAADRKLGVHSTYAKFATAFKGFKHSALRLQRDANATDVPESVDWATQGAVTPVKDQGQCGSCWAFSTTGSMEGAYFYKNKVLKSFSEQMLVDCDRNDEGCNGGLMDNAFDWLQQNGGICSEDDYPYSSGLSLATSYCRASCAKVAGTVPTTYTDVKSSDAALMAAVAQQPVSVAIEADQASFQSYSSGVLTRACGTSLDHGVLVVGYGTLDGVDYWKVKNSWGPAWGQEGYILLARGIAQAGGQCGILSAASYPSL